MPALISMNGEGLTHNPHFRELLRLLAGLSAIALPVRRSLGEGGPSLALLQKPDMLPRHVQLFRKALLVDRPLGGGGYLLEWAVKNLRLKS